MWVAPVSALRGTALGVQGPAAAGRVRASGRSSSRRGSSRSAAWPARVPVGALATVRFRGRGADGSGSCRVAPKVQEVLFRVRVFCSVRCQVRAVRRLFSACRQFSGAPAAALATVRPSGRCVGCSGLRDSQHSLGRARACCRVRISGPGRSSSRRGSSCPSAWPARAPVGAQATVRSRGRSADGSGGRLAAPKAHEVLFRVRVFCSVRLLVRAVRRPFFWPAVILSAPRPLPWLQYGRGDDVPVVPVFALRGTALGAHWLAAVVRISGSGTPSSRRGSSLSTARPTCALVVAPATVGFRGRGADGSDCRCARRCRRGLRTGLFLVCSCEFLLMAAVAASLSSLQLAGAPVAAPATVQH